MVGVVVNEWKSDVNVSNEGNEKSENTATETKITFV